MFESIGDFIFNYFYYMTFTIEETPPEYRVAYLMTMVVFILGLVIFLIGPSTIRDAFKRILSPVTNKYTKRFGPLFLPMWHKQRKLLKKQDFDDYDRFDISIRQFKEFYYLNPKRYSLSQSRIYVYDNNRTVGIIYYSDIRSYYQYCKFRWQVECEQKMQNEAAQYHTVQTATRRYLDLVQSDIERLQKSVESDIDKAKTIMSEITKEESE